MLLVPSTVSSPSPHPIVGTWDGAVAFLDLNPTLFLSTASHSKGSVAHLGSKGKAPLLFCKILSTRLRNKIEKGLFRAKRNELQTLFLF